MGIDRPFELFYSKVDADLMYSDLMEFHIEDFISFKEIMDPIDRWDLLRDYTLVGANCWSQERSHHSRRTEALC